MKEEERDQTDPFAWHKEVIKALKTVKESYPGFFDFLSKQNDLFEKSEFYSLTCTQLDHLLFSLEYKFSSDYYIDLASQIFSDQHDDSYFIYRVLRPVRNLIYQHDGLEPPDNEPVVDDLNWDTLSPVAKFGQWILALFKSILRNLAEKKHPLHKNDVLAFKQISVLACYQVLDEMTSDEGQNSDNLTKITTIISWVNQIQIDQYHPLKLKSNGTGYGFTDALRAVIVAAQRTVYDLLKSVSHGISIELIDEIILLFKADTQSPMPWFRSTIGIIRSNNQAIIDQITQWREEKGELTIPFSNSVKTEYLLENIRLVSPEGLEDTLNFSARIEALSQIDNYETSPISISTDVGNKILDDKVTTDSDVEILNSLENFPNSETNLIGEIGKKSEEVTVKNDSLISDYVNNISPEQNKESGQQSEDEMNQSLERNTLEREEPTIEVLQSNWEKARDDFKLTIQEAMRHLFNFKQQHKDNPNLNQIYEQEKKQRLSELNKIWRGLGRDFHPDRYQATSLKEKAEEIFKELGIDFDEGKSSLEQLDLEQLLEQLLKQEVTVVKQQRDLLMQKKTVLQEIMKLANCLGRIEGRINENEKKIDQNWERSQDHDRRIEEMGKEIKDLGKEIKNTGKEIKNTGEKIDNFKGQIEIIKKDVEEAKKLMNKLIHTESQGGDYSSSNPHFFKNSF